MKATYELPKHREQCLVSLDRLTEPHEVIIKPKSNSRSAAQNRLLHMWYREYGRLHGEHYGVWYTHDEVEWIMKTTLLPIEIIEVDGREIPKLTSTSSLSIGEMASYLTQIDHYAGSEKGIILPHPEDYRLAVGYDQD